jgi:hypothetical protein
MAPKHCGSKNARISCKSAFIPTTSTLRKTSYVIFWVYENISYMLCFFFEYGPDQLIRVQ